MILSTSAIVLSLLIQDPIQPKALERLSKEVIENLMIPPSEANNLFNVLTFNIPTPSPSLRIKEVFSIQRTVFTSLATIRNETALQQALSNSIATKEEEDIKRAIELSILTKIEENNIRKAIDNSLATKEEEDIKRAIELSKITKIEEDNSGLETNNSSEPTNSSVTTTPDLASPQTNKVTQQLEQKTVTKEPDLVPETTVVASQASQNEAPAEPILIPQTAPIAPQPEQNTVVEEPTLVPEATVAAPQAPQNEAPAEPMIVPQTTPVVPQPEQNTVVEEPTLVPEATVAAPQAPQNEAPAEPMIVPQTIPVAPQPEQNTVAEEPTLVPEATVAAPQAPQNEAPAEPIIVPNTPAIIVQLEQNEPFTASGTIPTPPIPPAPPIKLLNKAPILKLEKAKPSQKSGVVQKVESSKDLLNVLLQNRIAPQKQEDRKDVTLTKETLIGALKKHQDEIGLSDKDLQLLETQSLETLKPIINEFYNEENKEWDFGFADQQAIMSRLSVAPNVEEEKPQTKNIGKLNIQKNETSLSTAIREARGSQKNEETIVSSASTNTSQDSARIISTPKATDIPQAPAAPKVLSSKAQDTLVKLKKNKEAAKSDTGMTFLEQILNKDTLVKLKTPTPEAPELKDESSKSLNDVLTGSLAARRKSMEIDDASSDDEAWD